MTASKTPRTDAVIAAIPLRGDSYIGDLCERQEKLFDLCRELEGSLSETQSELERERMRLAGCSAAALGYFDGCHEDYKSASLADVLALAERERKSRDYAEACADVLRRAKSTLEIGRQFASDPVEMVQNWSGHASIVEGMIDDVLAKRCHEIVSTPKRYECDSSPAGCENAVGIPQALRDLYQIVLADDGPNEPYWTPRFRAVMEAARTALREPPFNEGTRAYEVLSQVSKQEPTT